MVLTVQSVSDAPRTILTGGLSSWTTINVSADCVQQMLSNKALVILVPDSVCTNALFFYTNIVSFVKHNI